MALHILDADRWAAALLTWFPAEDDFAVTRAVEQAKWAAHHANRALDLLAQLTEE